MKLQITMKNLSLLLSITLSVIILMSFTNKNKAVKTYELSEVNYTVPNDVQEIINNSCYGCHNSDSKSKKGKMKLNFDKMSTMKIGKRVGKLNKIHGVVEENDMPPKKFLKKYPEKALNEEDSKKLASWAIEMASQYINE